MGAQPNTIPEPVSESREALEAKLGRVTQRLAGLNRELASQMILLASQTGDATPLVGAVKALRKVQSYYSADQAPRDTADVHASLGDALLVLGRARNDHEVLAHAVESYRSAITLCSLLGDDATRRLLRAKYREAQAAMDSRRDISA